MDTNTIIIIIAVFAAQAIPVALFLHLYKKMDDVQRELSSFKLDMKDALKEVGIDIKVTKERLNSTNIRIDKNESDITKITDKV